jgi:hypothetical protein
MGIITRFRKIHDAVYWAWNGFDAFGKATFATPIDIKCRWDDVSQEYKAVPNLTNISNSLVYPNRLVTLNGYLLKGTLAANVLFPANPMKNAGAFKIQRVDTISKIRGGSETLWIAYL